MKYEGLVISESNSKLGHIHNWAVDRNRTCPMKCPGCYAGKGHHNQTSVRNARTINTDACMENLDDVQDKLMQFFMEYRPPFFRIHEEGDFYSVAYAQMWYRVMAMNQPCQFNIFTKSYDIVRAVPFYTLKNCHLFLSSWIGLDIPEDLREHYPVAWFIDKKGFETRYPEKVHLCPGSKLTCLKCQWCFGRGNNQDVGLREH